MTTAAITGFGALYEISTTTGGSVYTAVGEVIDMNLPQDEADDVEATHYQSPSNTREYIGGPITPGEGGFTINWIPGNSTDLFLRALRLSRATRNHRITFPNGAKVVFPAFIKGYAPSVPIDDRLTAEFTIRKAGAETWS